MCAKVQNRRGYMFFEDLDSVYFDIKIINRLGDLMKYTKYSRCDLVVDVQHSKWESCKSRCERTWLADATSSGSRAGRICSG
jgi:hypothetical protein